MGQSSDQLYQPVKNIQPCSKQLKSEVDPDFRNGGCAETGNHQLPPVNRESFKELQTAVDKQFANSTPHHGRGTYISRDRPHSA